MGLCGLLCVCLLFTTMPSHPRRFYITVRQLLMRCRLQRGITGITAQLSDLLLSMSVSAAKYKRAFILTLSACQTCCILLLKYACHHSDKTLCISTAIRVEEIETRKKKQHKVFFIKSYLLSLLQHLPLYNLGIPEHLIYSDISLIEHWCLQSNCATHVELQKVKRGTKNWNDSGRQLWCRFSGWWQEQV